MISAQLKVTLRDTEVGVDIGSDDRIATGGEVGAEGGCGIGVAERGARGELKVGAAIGLDDGKTTGGDVGTEEGCVLGAGVGHAAGDTQVGGNID